MQWLRAFGIAFGALICACSSPDLDGGGAEGSESALERESDCRVSFAKLTSKEASACELGAVAPRVGRLGGGSAVILSAARDASSVIILSVAHVREAAETDPAGEPAGAEAEDIDPASPGSASVAVPASSTPVDLAASAAGTFALLDANGKLDKRTVDVENVYYPGSSDWEPKNDFWFLTAKSPSARAAARGFRAVHAGERVRLVGIATGDLGPRFTACSVLDDDAARAAIERLAKEGDEEGTIPYNPEVEALCEGGAFPGMSGGGVFTDDGLVVGTTVRGSNMDASAKQPIARFVRATYAVSRLRTALAAAPASDRTRLEALLPADLLDK